jgi:hypothetical protein
MARVRRSVLQKSSQNGKVSSCADERQVAQNSALFRKEGKDSSVID